MNERLDLTDLYPGDPKRFEQSLRLLAPHAECHNHRHPRPPGYRCRFDPAEADVCRECGHVRWTHDPDCTHGFDRCLYHCPSFR